MDTYCTNTCFLGVHDYYCKKTIKKGEILSFLIMILIEYSNTTYLIGKFIENATRLHMFKWSVKPKIIEIGWAEKIALLEKTVKYQRFSTFWTMFPIEYKITKAIVRKLIENATI